jgi:hypothetical protein
MIRMARYLKLSSCYEAAGVMAVVIAGTEDRAAAVDRVVCGAGRPPDRPLRPPDKGQTGID